MKTLIAIAIIFSYGTCHSVKKAVPKSTVVAPFGNDSTLIWMSKTPCFGKCPVYTIDIHANGKVIFDGSQNISKIGTYEKQLSKGFLDSLTQTFEDAHFFDFKDNYTAMMTSIPTTFIRFVHDGKDKKIRDYYNAPQTLHELENRIIEIVNEDNWTQITQKKQ
ncbi:MAG TPA: DUF6438 domain-containing protein [Bacteroidia bacterium]|nr:DUF6438 domain-containing protein [Bacteroidia bacterium]